MTSLRYCSIFFMLAAAGPGGAQEAEPFNPFQPRAYRLVNSIDFAPDGTMYFALLYREVLAHRGHPDSTAPEVRLFSARPTRDGWTEPQLVQLGGDFKDYEATLTHDGSLMVFNSQRPYPDGRTPERNDLWMVERRGSTWDTPRRIEAITTFEHEESYGTLTADRTLIFLRETTNVNGDPSYDLYETRMVHGRFVSPTRHPVSTDQWGEGDPWVAPDGSYLIFTRWDDTVGWEESVDLYIAFRVGNTWSEPVPLDVLNTDGPDFGPAVSRDGEWLYSKSGSRFHRVRLAPILARYRPT